MIEKYINQLENKYENLKTVFDLRVERYLKSTQRPYSDGIYIDKKELDQFNNEITHINSEMGKYLQMIDFLKELKNKECKK